MRLSSVYLLYILCISSVDDSVKAALKEGDNSILMVCLELGEHNRSGVGYQKKSVVRVWVMMSMSRFCPMTFIDRR